MGPCQTCKQKEKNSEIIIPDDISTIKKSGRDTPSKISKQQNGSFVQNWSDFQIDNTDQKKLDQQQLLIDKNIAQAQNNQNDENIRRPTNTYFCSIENDVESNKNKVFNNAIIDINENKSDIEILLELEKMNSNLNENDSEEKEKKPKLHQQFDQLTQTNKSQTSKTQTNNQTYTNKTREKEQQSEHLSLNNILKDLDD